jgi:hypothetical protein
VIWRLTALDALRAVQRGMGMVSVSFPSLTLTPIRQEP